ncbi:MAG: tRNA (adenosine(37)-N6)-dimethylallyltransferase MiaA [Patescibacteria group bacterium]
MGTFGKQKIIAIVGTTAAGKTAIGVEIAKKFDGELISVDSRQVYCGMDIGTNKEDTSPIVQWGIDIVDPSEDYCVADFKIYAEQKIKEIAGRGKLPILVGGTGLWLQAVIDNFDLSQAEPNPELRARLEARDLDDLIEEYERIDPNGAQVVDLTNKRRVVRALEVVLSTGKSFVHQSGRGESKYNALQIGLKIDRDVLYERINARVDEMMQQGLLDEVCALRDKYGCTNKVGAGFSLRSLWRSLKAAATKLKSTNTDFCNLPSMSGIGYRQLCKYLDGAIALEQAVEEIKKDTRNYAKRQITWFKRDERIRWVKGVGEAIELVNDFI